MVPTVYLVLDMRGSGNNINFSLLGEPHGISVSFPQSSSSDVLNAAGVFSQGCTPAPL